ncbi:transposable element Tcb1 transposase [Trichonephila clavipes]|nr:transposable element Tcb1 transposase [Trichonephila clavipes]
MNFFYSKDNFVALHFKYDQARRRFVEWAQNEIAVVPDFHKRILFSDEAHFWLNGYVNKQNCRIWSEANPQTTSGCFYPRSNHWEVGGRPQCDKCGCRVRNCSQHRFTTLETISNYRNSYPGFSSVRPRGTTPTDDRYIVLQVRRNRRQTAREIARHTTQATGRPISRFIVARRLRGGDLFARRPVRCQTLTPAHRRRRSLWCREHRNWRDNEWGRVLHTDESRFSLSSDSHRILI